MRLQGELAVVVLGFVALNLLLVFAAIGLFVRMGPAIERILLRNDATIVTAEEILEVLARNPTGPASTTDRERVAVALDRASNNITEGGEEPVIDSIKEYIEPVLEGHEEHRGALVEGLHELVAINRAAMRSVDRDAQRLGTAGAWVASFVGLASLGLTVFLSRSLGSRIVRPILELRQVLLATQSGDRFRRCSIQRAPAELREALTGVNQLLDALAPTGGDGEVDSAAPAAMPGAGGRP